MKMKIYQNLWDIAKAVLREKFITSIYRRGKVPNQKLSSHIKNWKKRNNKKTTAS